MAAVHQLTREEARRVAVRAQLLDVERPTDLMDAVRRLTGLQVDLTTAVVPSPDLVLWSRIGSAYSTQDLRDAVDEQRLVDLSGTLLPVEDVVLYTAEMAAWPGSDGRRPWQRAQRAWVEANHEFREDILAVLRADGPLPMSALPDTSVVPWESSGWTNDRNVSRMLDFLVARGEVAVAGRDGRHRLFDLASRVYPDEPAVPLEEALRIRADRRLRSLGIMRTRAADGAGEAASVVGTAGTWRVDPDQLGRSFGGRTALLSPLDRLVFDRKRTADLFGFDYQLEMYKPAAARRWGYWALPILHGDLLVGKLDATFDRTLAVLRVDAVHEDEPFAPAVRAAVDQEIEALAEWLEGDLDRSDR